MNMAFIMKTWIGKKLFLATIVGATLSTSLKADDSFEFDDAVLQGLGFDNVDLSAFAGSNDQFAGEYLVDLSLNGVHVARDYPVQFYSIDGDSNLCFTDDLLQTLAIKKEFFSGSKSEYHEIDAGICYPVQSLDSMVLVDFDSNVQHVKVGMPQKYLGNLDPHWVKPRDRDYGINGVVLDYNLLWEFARSDYGNSRRGRSDIRSHGSAGFNWDRFRFRANYQYSNKAYNDKLEWTQIYGFTDIASINSKLYAGEIYSRSELFDNTRIKGISLYSDENMMPSYLKGYAPQVTGIANSNAIVVVKQHGNTLKTIQVPAGPFVISDLPSYVTGKVSVEIEEEDGTVRTSQFDIATVPFLTRKGGVRYYANVGELDPFFSKKVDTKLVSADGSYGLTSNVSVFGGVQFTTDHKYKAYNIGAGVNMGEFGAFSFDITKSKASEIRNSAGKEFSGHSYRFNYAKRFSTDTMLNIAGYRFSSKEFIGLSNYLNYIENGSMQDMYLEKNRISLSISQYVPEWDVSFTGTLSKGSYWNSRGTSNYNLTTSKTIRSGALKNVSLTLSLSQDNGRYLGGKDRQIGLFVSVPLEEESRRSSLQYSGIYGSFEKHFDHQVTYHTSVPFIDENSNFTVGARTNHKRDFSGSIDYGINATLSGETGYGRYSVFADHSDYRSGVRASYDGALTITKHGIATHKTVYNDGSRLILDAGAPGVSIPGGRSKSNTFGLIGVENLTSYRNNTYSIDNDNLPDNVEIQDGVVQLAVSDGAIAYRSLNGISGEKAIATITLADGTYPPFGAAVFRKNGDEKEIAIVAGDGLTYLTGLNTNSAYVVRWNGSECQLKIGNLEPNDLNNLICY